MTTLFISDLHLTQEQPETIRLFLEFLNNQANQAETLYILGDLFEAWLGDDIILPEYTPVIEALRKLSNKGIAVKIMHGNRDFLMGNSFEEITGAELIPDPTVIELDGQQILLLHGDTLCIDDTPYQQLREQLRHPTWISEFLGKSAEERISFAKHLREKSKEATSKKEAYIMDVNAQAVEQVMKEHQVQLLIHGHTHRPAIHELQINNQSAQRIVLGDWHEHGSVLVADKGQFDLRTL